MNTKIIGSVVLGSLLLAMQPAAIAGKCMTVGVATKDGSVCIGMEVVEPYNATLSVHTLVEHTDEVVVLGVETGTESFRDAVSMAIGEAASYRANGCKGAHVSIEATDPMNCSDEHGVDPMM